MATTLRPASVVQTATTDGLFLTEMVCSDALGLLCLASSDRIIKLYNASRMSFVSDIEGHTAPIADLVVSPGAPDILYSVQEDAGVMVSDLRMQRPARYLNELQSEGKTSYSIAVSDDGLSLAVACAGDVYTVDTRTYTSSRFFEFVHNDDITRMRYCGSNVIMTSGEDMMANFVGAVLRDNDSLLSASSIGECLTRIRWFPQLNAVGAVGSCESGYIFPVPGGIDALVAAAGATVVEEEAAAAAGGRRKGAAAQSSFEPPDFGLEVKIPRPSESTYLVDWVMGTAPGGAECLYAISGEHQVYESEDAVAAPRSTLVHMTAFDGQGQAGETLNLFGAHHGVVRAALTHGSTVFTAGEDGILAAWRPAGESEAASSSSGGSTKERAVAASASARKARPY